MRSRFPQLVLLCLLAMTVPAAAHAQRGGGPGGGHSGGGGGMGRPEGGNGGLGGGVNGNADDMGRRGRPNMQGGGAPPMATASGLHGPLFGPPGRWWDDKRLVRNLSLRPDQQRRMDEIFDNNRGQLRNLYTNLQRERQHLAGLSAADRQDEAKVYAAIDGVAQSLAALEKENAHVMLEIRQQLDAEQLARLDQEAAAGR